MCIQKITNLLAFLILSFAGSALAQQEPLVKDVQITSNISYALVDGFDLKLDLYLPRSISNPESSDKQTKFVFFEKYEALINEFSSKLFPVSSGVLI